MHDMASERRPAAENTAPPTGTSTVYAAYVLVVLMLVNTMNSIDRVIV